MLCPHHHPSWVVAFQALAHDRQTCGEVISVACCLPVGPTVLITAEHCIDNSVCHTDGESESSLKSVMSKGCTGAQ